MELFSKNNNWLSLLNIKFLKKRIYFRFFRNLKSLKFKFKVNRLFWYLFPIKKYYIKKENNNRHYNTNKFFIMFKNYRQLIKKKSLLIKKKNLLLFFYFYFRLFLNIYGLSLFNLKNNKLKFINEF